MDKRVQGICRILNKAGHQCFLVGGAVRDILMDRAPKDFDLVTDATPTEVEKLFSKTISVGKQFGVIVVIEDGKTYEVATFRSEHGYSDSRHPDTVTWSTPEQDAERRDFTINALFYDPLMSEVTDYVNGKADLTAKRVRFIGDPAARIIEDHLRLLRAVRLRSELGFEYEPATWQAIVDHAPEIATVSAQRIRDELNKMLLTPGRVEALEDLDKSGLLKVVLPELEALHGINQEWKFHGKGDVLTHTLLAVKVLPQDIKLEVVWGTLLHDIGKPATKATVPDKRFGGTRTGFYGHHEVGAKIAEALLRRLRFPNEQIEFIVWLVRHHMMIHEILEMRVGRQKRWLLDPRLPDLLELHRADASGKGEGKRINLQAYQEVKKLMQDERAKPPPPPKLVDGNDLMKEFHLKPGPKVGEFLKLVDDAVWEGTVKTKAEAIDLLRHSISTSSHHTFMELEKHIGIALAFLDQSQSITITENLEESISEPIRELTKQLTQCFKSPELESPLAYIIAELADNIIEHAQAKAWRWGLYCGEHVLVAIADDGIGIADSLKKAKGTFASDSAALEAALQGVSEKGPERGFGLPSTVNLVTKGFGGSLYVISDSLGLNVGSDTYKKWIDTVPYKGTLVVMVLPKTATLSGDQFYELIAKR